MDNAEHIEDFVDSYGNIPTWIRDFNILCSDFQIPRISIREMILQSMNMKPYTNKPEVLYQRCHKKLMQRL